MRFTDLLLSVEIRIKINKVYSFQEKIECFSACVPLRREKT